MNLGELKKSLAKFPPDMNDMEVMITFPKNGKRDFDLLCFVGYLPLKGSESIALGTLGEVQRMVENGEMSAPNGYIPPNYSNN